MGRKQADKPAEKAAEPEETEEDTPIVKELKEIDVRYLAIEKEYEKELAKLRAKFEEKQQPLLNTRKDKLSAPVANGPSTGTPALPDFWVQALKNHPIGEVIMEWDEPVMSHLQDITKDITDAENPEKGFKLSFHFAENDWFEHKVLAVTFDTEEPDPYNGEQKVNSVKCEPESIEWKAGKDITVEKIVKKVKGGGAKKAKQKGKEKEEPRESFFRLFFRSLKADDEVPDDIRQLYDSGEDDEEDEDMDMEMEDILDQTFEMGCGIRDQIIPFAVRWYTGEASPDDDDDDDDEDEEEEDDDDDDEESDDEPPAKGKKGKAKPKKEAKGGGGEAGAKKEECKQQ